MTARPVDASISSEDSPIRVAVVEDDRRVRESLCDILRSSDACQLVGWFTSGEQAMSGLAEVDPRVIVVDVNLPTPSSRRCRRGRWATS